MRVSLILVTILLAAAMAAPAWPAGETTVLQLSANGSRSTRPFTVAAGWEVRWESTASNFSIWILDKEGNPIEHAASQEKPGKGTSYYAKPGTYSLKINSRGDWTITVVQLP